MGEAARIKSISESVPRTGYTRSYSWFGSGPYGGSAVFRFCKFYNSGHSKNAAAGLLGRYKLARNAANGSANSIRTSYEQALAVMAGRASDGCLCVSGARTESMDLDAYRQFSTQGSDSYGSGALAGQPKLD